MDACEVNGEKVTAQESDFYGGWITKNIVGPLKGKPGTGDWQNDKVIFCKRDGARQTIPRLHHIPIIPSMP